MDEDLDTSGIPDFAPNPVWAKGPPSLIKAINGNEDYAVPTLTRETLIAQLYLEAMDRSSRNQPARIAAMKLIAELKGWTESTEDVIDENIDNVTAEEAKLIAEEFEKELLIMPIAIKLKDNKIPENCYNLSIDLANHRNECLDCTIAHMNKLPAENYCKIGYSILEKLGNQPEVSQV